MIGRRVIGLSLLCAFVFCAVAAPNAMAEKKTTTAYTCVEKGGTLDFKDAHCTEQVTQFTGKFGHVEIKVDETTEKVIGTGTATSKLKGTVAGVETEIECTTTSASGHLRNTTNAAKEMSILGTKIKIKYSGCTVTRPTKNCTVAEPIETVELEGTTLEKGMAAEFKSEVKGPLLRMGAELDIKGEKCAAKGKPPVEGSVIAPINGSTISTTHEQTTKDATLTVGAKPAGLAGTSTLSMEGGSAISATTTVDP